MENFWPVFLLATLGSVAGLLGGVFLVWNKKVAGRISLLAIPFAAGVLLAVTFLDVLPEAVDDVGAELALLVVLISIVAAFLFEGFVSHLHHHDGEDSAIGESLPLVIFGDTIHNFIDGLVIAASFLVSPSLGLVVAFATFAHEIPHEMGDFGLMLAGGWGRAKVLMVNFTSSLSTYAGALLGLFLGGGETLGVLLSIAGGVFLYIGASDLLPQVHRGKGGILKKVGLFLLGILVMWGVGKIN